MRIELLRDEHINDSAKLFVDEYKRQRSFVSALPEVHEDISLMAVKLQAICEKNPGVVAIENGQVVGYMVGYLLDNLKSSHRGVYIPEWGHSAVPESKREIYQQLYNKISARWVRDEYVSHAITVLAYDKELREQWFWNGFGMLTVDAIRSIDRRIENNAAQEIAIKKAELSDMKALLELQLEHQRYYSKAPLFMAMFEFDDEKFFEEWLRAPENNIFIAYNQGEPIGFMWINPSGDNASYIVTDAKTASITGAFVKPTARQSGIGRQLLCRAEQWAVQNGYKRIALDFESANILGSRFWLKHFEPVCFSLIRRIDDRLTKAINYTGE